MKDEITKVDVVSRSFQIIPPVMNDQSLPEYIMFIGNDGSPYREEIFLLDGWMKNVTYRNPVSSDLLVALRRGNVKIIKIFQGDKITTYKYYPPGESQKL